MENNKTPSIRFKGFTDPWEQRKLLSCIEKITDFRGRTPKKLGMDWSESGYLALSALNVKDGYIDFSQDVHYGEQALYDKWMSGNELHKGQVLFTTEAPMGNVAQVPDNKRYILSQRTIAFDVKEDIITENFLATLLRSPAVFNTLTSLSSGGTAKGVSQKSLAGVDIQIPVELREQELLATYFANLDNLITLHQRKYNKLLNVKKSMLEKMFPKNGSNIPEIRFKGFTDPWEQRKLGELADIVGGGTPSTGVSDYWDGDIDWYAPAEIAEQIYLTSSQRKITEEGYNHSSAKMLPVGTVLFTSRAGIGKTAILTQKGCTNQGFQSIVPHKIELDSYFIFSRTEELKQYGETVGAGSTFVEVSGKQMANMELMMPKTMAEQKTIGQYFASLDNLITLHQRELEKLQNIKKSMLEKMFV